MAYTPSALKERILEMYPEMKVYGVETGVEFVDGENAYIIRLGKGRAGLTTYIRKADADSCMDGISCANLGLKVGEFIRTLNSDDAQRL